MHQEVIKSSQHWGLFSNIDQITCLSDRIIEDTVSDVIFLCTVDDIIKQIPIVSVQHIYKVYNCLCVVLTDLHQESQDQ